MKTVRLSLVAALAAFGLQACDINVKPQTQVTAPQSSLPDDAVLNAPATPTAAAPAAQPADAQQPAAPVDSTPTPVQSTEAPVAPVAPDTQAMGAQPGAPAVAVPDGVAAPTELAQFLEKNVIKPKAP